MISGATDSNGYELFYYKIPGTDELVEMNVPKDRVYAIREWMTRVKDKNLPLDKVQDEFNRWYEWRTQLLKDIKSTLEPLIK